MTRPIRVSRDETGATLLMVLAAVLFIGIVFSAILGFQATGMRAQTVLSDKANAELATDAALDTAIAQMQADRTIGTAAGSVCDQLTPVRSTTWTAPDVGPIDVECQMLSASNGVNLAPRIVRLVAQGEGARTRAEVTIFDPPDGSVEPSVVSVTQWEREDS